LANKLKKKIGIIGAGRVGSTAAFCIANCGYAKEIILIDVIEELAEGEAEDINQAITLFAKPTITISGNYEDLSDCPLVIITAGARRKPEETRLDLARKNLSLTKEIVQKIASINKYCILLVVTNPVDILTYFSFKISGFKKEKVFGLGTYLDTLRLWSFMNREGKEKKDSIVIGEHGDSMVFVSFDDTEIIKKVKSAGAELIRKKGGCGWAVGMAISDVAKSVLLDERRVFPISSVIDDIAISIPTVVGKEGILDYPELKLSQKEKEAFSISSKIIKDEITKISL